jgi:hypothetical protein
MRRKHQMKAVPPDSILQSTEQGLPVVQTVAKILAWVFAWVLSVQLADVQVVVSIVGGLAVLVYTGLNTYVLWRDKVRRKAGAAEVAE